jgi:hypothetical protein
MGVVEEGPGLADAIELVRSQLEEAIERGSASSVAFEAGPVELEFDVVFSATGGGDAGVRLWVVSVGAKSEVTRGQTNRLTVTLTPVDRATGKKKLIGDVAEE